jgi:hypothetical protein
MSRGFGCSLDPFKGLVKERCGLSCEGNSEEKLAHALNERVAALAIKAADYYARLTERRRISGTGESAHHQRNLFFS